MSYARRLLALSLACGTAACSADAPSAPSTRAAAPSVAAVAAPPPPSTLFQRYVAIGTSVSMGWQSDGVLAAFQQASWPAQLASLAGVSISLPLIAPTGCPAPIIAPLALGRRLSGESSALPFPTPSLICSPNVPGVVLPTQNVAIVGALTAQALLATPSNVVSPFDQRIYSRVLPPTLSQVGAMAAQRPLLVSVELGANEVLGARNGVLIPGATTVPLATWIPQYRAVLDAVQATAPYAVLVGLLNRSDALPGFRRGWEVWNARATFAPLNVQVAGDCRESTNLLFLSIIVPTAAAQGAARPAGSPFVLSCTNIPSSTGIQDFILSGAEAKQLDAILAEMNLNIRREASRRGFAYFELADLFEKVNVKGPVNALAIMTSQTPWGPYTSLDGVHPSAQGHAVLAAAAAAALDARYGTGITAVH